MKKVSQETTDKFISVPTADFTLCLLINLFHFLYFLVFIPHNRSTKSFPLGLYPTFLHWGCRAVCTASFFLPPFYHPYYPGMYATLRKPWVIHSRVRIQTCSSVATTLHWLSSACFKFGRQQVRLHPLARCRVRYSRAITCSQFN